MHSWNYQIDSCELLVHIVFSMERRRHSHATLGCIASDNNYLSFALVTEIAFAEPLDSCRRILQETDNP